MTNFILKKKYSCYKKNNSQISYIEKPWSISLVKSCFNFMTKIQIKSLTVSKFQRKIIPKAELKIHYKR